jgi:hypothetical protein
MEKGRRDGPTKALSGSRRNTNTPLEPAAFLNIDLDIRSRLSLAPLLEVWPTADQPERPSGRRAPRWLLVRHASPEHRAENTAKRLLRDVEKMPRSARRCWDRASSRTFDVGIQAGPPGRSFEEVQFSPGTLARIAAVGGLLKVTVYPPYGMKDGGS